MRLPIKEPIEFHQPRDASYVKKVEKILNKGIIQLSESPWSSPAVLVRKERLDLAFVCILLAAQ